MFSYYGSKSKIAKYYPKPLHNKIIEPFAGTAKYSLFGTNWENDVLLIDKFHKIIEIWHYLQNVTPKELLSLPNIAYKQKIPELLSDAERWLIGYCINRGSVRPATLANKFNNWEQDKKRIADNLYKIKHWNIILGDYESIENQQATWFIDPPYQVGGHKYNFHKIDYPKLLDWSKNRNGQIILCENSKNSWLENETLTNIKEINGAYGKSSEVMFYLENNR